MGRCPPFLSHAASLPLVVVLPEPCSPAIRMTVGGLEAKLKRAVSLPSSAISSSRTILMTCSEGESAVSTSVPTAFSRMCSISSRTTLRLTSASSRATRISRRASAMFSSVSVPCPRRLLKARCSLSVRFSNIGLLQVYRECERDADSAWRAGLNGRFLRGLAKKSFLRQKRASWPRAVGFA